MDASPTLEVIKMKKSYKTVRDIAAALGVSPATVVRWINESKIQAYQVGPYERSPFRIPLAEAERVIREFGPPVESEPTPP